MKKASAIVMSTIMLAACGQVSAEKMKDKQQQLAELKDKQILVAMWGWEPEIMAPAAVEFGYDVINQPQGSDTVQHGKDIPIWHQEGLGMLVRPDLFSIRDPFDEEQVKAGYANLKRVIQFHEENNPAVEGYVIQWGMFGEGGFEWGFKFSEKAQAAFNKFAGTPGEPLPEGPTLGNPGTLRWVKWMEFRADFLRNFRADFVTFAKQFTDKLVGTWSEVYPTDNYILNMGDAPGADFMFYDLSFGDVTCNQRIAFGESHGEMEAFPTFEAWLKHELPLMAKATGEGVTPMSFQFPMREGDAVANIVGKKQYTISKIEDEYSLKIGPYIRELLDAVALPIPEAEVAVVYQSFQAGALPADTYHKIFANRAMGFYRGHSKAIEGALHQMGVHMRAIPYEWLGNHDLSQYKLVIVPDPMYLSPAMRSNLGKAKRVLYSGEFLMAHRNEKTQKGDYLSEFTATTADPALGNVNYLKADAGAIKVATDKGLMKGVSFPADKKYPADQMFVMEKLPKRSKVLATVDGKPAIFTTNKGKTIFVANRAFCHGWKMKTDWLENGMFTFLQNVLEASKVEIPVVSGPQVRANQCDTYGAYGVSGNIAWNATDADISIELKNGQKLTIPKNGWAPID